MQVRQEANAALEDSRACWPMHHADRVATLVVLLGFLARLWVAWGAFLNPDEALHYRLANQASLALAYNESLTASHPPLLTVLLYYFRLLGTSEPWLRMPSIFAGTLFCWLFFKWLANATNQLTGFLGLLLVSFLLPIVTLSAEIRQYALLLCFLAGALYFFDRAVESNSMALMVVSLASLYLALSSHYSGFLFTAALGVYALLKIWARRPGRSLIVAWVVGQAGALALGAFYYKTHIARLGAGESRPVLQGWMSDFFLRRSYFEAGRDNPFLFVVGHTFGVFQFFFGQLAMGDIVGLLFFAGVVLLFRARIFAAKGPMNNVASSRVLGIFLLSLFALACCLSLFHLYPYGGTRHDAFLIIPGVAGVSVSIAAIAGQRWNRGIALTLSLIALCIVFGKTRPPRMDRADQSTQRMAAAINFVNQRIASADLIFTDYQTDLMLGHYLCSQRPISFDPAPDGFEQFECSGRRIVSADYKSAWMFSAENFQTQWRRFVQAYRLKPGQEVWVVQMGWGIDLPEDLRRTFREFRDLPSESFGSNIKIFRLTVTAANTGPITESQTAVNAGFQFSGLRAHSTLAPEGHSHQD